MKEWEIIAQNKRKVEAIKRRRGCEKCGDKETKRLLFHHIDPHTRKFMISQALTKPFREIW